MNRVCVHFIRLYGAAAACLWIFVAFRASHLDGDPALYGPWIGAVVLVALVLGTFFRGRFHCVSASVLSVAAPLLVIAPYRLLVCGTYGWPSGLEDGLILAIACLLACSVWPRQRPVLS